MCRAYIEKLSRIDVSMLTGDVPQLIPIGAYKLDGKWLWIDDSEVDFNLTNWQEGEPTGTNDAPENCMGYDPSKQLGLSDMPCETNVKYFCQMNPEEDSKCIRITINIWIRLTLHFSASG